jgi:uncharacterized protein (DUF1684 family)
MMGSEYLELLDWRRRVAELFAELRRRPADAAPLAWFRGEKDALFKYHPQSPIPADERASFPGLPYWPFDPAARVVARFDQGAAPPFRAAPVHPAAGRPLEPGLNPCPAPPFRAGDEEPRHTGTGAPEAKEIAAPRQEAPAEVAFTRMGVLTFTLYGDEYRLPAFWIAGYAGGLFVPFKDATSGHATYGGGRYLLDTIKSADLGSDLDQLTVVLDFNYAYHPSCAYDPVWVCPLAPPDSRLPIPIHAGEQSR